jgi:hypothetical protein
LNKSSDYILDNLTKPFTKEKEAIVSNLGENMRPEGLFILPSDIEIVVEDDYLFNLNLESDCDFYMNIDIEMMENIKLILLSKDIFDNVENESLLILFEEFSKSCDVSFMSSVLSIANEDNVEYIYKFFQYLSKNNSEVFHKSVEFLCQEVPIKMFSILMIYNFHRYKDDVKKENIEQFMRNWFNFCCGTPKNGEENNQKSKKKLLVSFITNTVKDHFYDISKFSTQIDDFCSQNSELKGIQKMKDAIYNQRKNRLDAKRS